MSEEQDVAEVIAAELIEGAGRMEEIGFSLQDITRGFELATEWLKAQVPRHGSTSD